MNFTEFTLLVAVCNIPAILTTIMICGMDTRWFMPVYVVALVFWVFVAVLIGYLKTKSKEGQ